ncbi:MAG: hypothetical protein M5R40_28190 [Anaerolineae bacterium]|nr:hypothetical protein [Anaerolineae bacterium]
MRLRHSDRAGAQRLAPLPAVSTLLALVCVALFVGMQIITAPTDSPTVDEQAHIARGLTYLRTGDLRLYTGHPPFINMLEALPLAARDDVVLPLDLALLAEPGLDRLQRRVSLEARQRRG